MERSRLSKLTKRVVPLVPVQVRKRRSRFSRQKCILMSPSFFSLPTFHLKSSGVLLKARLRRVFWRTKRVLALGPVTQKKRNQSNHTKDFFHNLGNQVYEQQLPGKFHQNYSGDLFNNFSTVNLSGNSVLLMERLFEFCL